MPDQEGAKSRSTSNLYELLPRWRFVSVLLVVALAIVGAFLVPPGLSQTAANGVVLVLLAFLLLPAFRSKKDGDQ